MFVTFIFFVKFIWLLESKSNLMYNFHFLLLFEIIFSFPRARINCLFFRFQILEFLSLNRLLICVALLLFLFKCAYWTFWEFGTQIFFNIIWIFFNENFLLWFFFPICVYVYLMHVLVSLVLRYVINLLFVNLSLESQELRLFLNRINFFLLFLLLEIQLLYLWLFFNFKKLLLFFFFI